MGLKSSRSEIRGFCPPHHNIQRKYKKISSWNYSEGKLQKILLHLSWLNEEDRKVYKELGVLDLAETLTTQVEIHTGFKSAVLTAYALALALLVLYISMLPTLIEHLIAILCLVLVVIDARILFS